MFYGRVESFSLRKGTKRSCRLFVLANSYSSTILAVLLSFANLAVVWRLEANKEEKLSSKDDQVWQLDRTSYVAAMEGHNDNVEACKTEDSFLERAMTGRRLDAFNSPSQLSLTHSRRRQDFS